MCKLGIIISTLPQEGDLQNKDTASDDIAGEGWASSNWDLTALCRRKASLWSFIKIGRGCLSPLPGSGEPVSLLP